MEDQPEVTILLLGDENVGKTTFLSRISQGNTGHSNDAPIILLDDHDQPFMFDIRLFDKPYRFEFYDNSSPTPWTVLKPDVVVVCFDISSRLSLIEMQRKWIKEIPEYLIEEKDIPVLVLGLKRDLRSETDPNGIIYPQEAHRIAQEMRCDKYMECSALTGELMHEVFEDICKTAAMTTTEKGGLAEWACMIM